MRRTYVVLGLVTVGVVLGATPSAGAACDTQTLKAKYDFYASVAASLVSPADASIVLQAVAPYPEGSAPPVVAVTADGRYDLQIPSKAAAFYVAGADALFQGNALVAGWAFLEAARRNPSEPTFLNNVAFVLLQYRLFTDARDVLQCAVALAPGFVSAHVNLGFALGSLGDYNGAMLSYLDAIINDPGNPDYVLLGTVASGLAGNLEVCRMLADMGRNMQSPYAFDWILGMLPPPPGEVSCPIPPPPYSSAFLEFMTLDYYSTLKYTDYIAPLADYAARVLTPALDNALTAQQTCVAVRTQGLDVCLGGCSGDPLCVGICHCRWESLIALCDVTRAQSYYAAYAAQAGFWNGLLEGWFGVEQGMLGDLRGQVSGAEHAFLTCLVANFDRLDSQGLLQDVGANLRAAEDDLQIAKGNLAGIVNFYCNRSIETWLYTGGPAASLEPQWCLGPVCFSYDPVSGTVGVSGAMLLAGKLTYDPVTGDWGVKLGLGAQFGVGQLTLGGGIYLKFSEGKVGIQPKVSYGPGDVSYFMGFERLNVPLSQYAPLAP